MAKLKMLAIDLGASSGRGIVGSFDGKKLTLEENHRFPNEPVTVAGTFTWDTLRIFHEIKNSIRKCALSEDKDIRSIGIDTWGVDFGLIDKTGRLMANPVHYRDTRTEGIIEYADKFVPRSELYNVTGLQFQNFNTVYQILASMRDEPMYINNAQKLLFTPDLLNYFLTGEMRCEYTIASTGAILDAKKRDFAYDLLKKFGIPSGIFAPIVQPGSVVGPLLPQVLEEVGNINAQVVNVAAHDTASAVVAVPATSDDFIFLSSGTWSIMGSEVKEPIISDASFKYNFTNEGGVENTIRFEKNITGLWLKQESKRQWEREGKNYTHDQLSDMALASKPLQSLIDPDDALFATPGNLPKRIAEYCKATGQHVPEDAGEIMRCIFESLALRYRYTAEKIDEMKGHKTPFINIIGGGTKEGLLCQFAADACGRPVHAGPVEATAIGNIMAQAIAAGELKNVAEAREVVRNSFEIEYYEPKNTESWDEGYERFKKLIEK
ncbi:MAG: rhamnulokinase [Clostridia bacterium]|nr:rhamnulokinase [Clostridia bacterium]